MSETQYTRRVIEPDGSEYYEVLTTTVSQRLSRIELEQRLIDLTSESLRIKTLLTDKSIETIRIESPLADVPEEKKKP